MNRPAQEVVFTDLDADAVSTPFGVDLPPMVHDFEALIVGWNVIQCADQLLVEVTKEAHQRTRRWIVVRFDAFHFDSPIEPGNRVHRSRPYTSRPPTPRRTA